MEREHLYWLIAIGLGLFAYLALRGGTLSHGQPQWQPDGEVMGMVDYGALSPVVCEPQHHIDPDGVVYLPCRYPARSGENITTLILKGFDPLFQSKPADQAWMVQPPSEVQF